MIPVYFVLGLVVLANALEAFHVNRMLDKHHIVLKWFATHIKLDPKNIPDEMPDDLRSLIGKEDETNSITRS